MKEYNKLVRDLIPEIIKMDGHTCRFHVAKSDEFEKKLYEKLYEEVTELVQKPCAEEIADILEVIETIAKLKKISLSEIKNKKLMKKANRGSFDMKFILESTDNPIKQTEIYRND